MIKSLKIIVILLSFLNANDLNRPKVALVLSGGGAKGFAHIGALKILDSLNIPIDFIVGTSIGAIAGAMYSIGYSGNEIEKIAFDTDWEAMFTDQVPRRDLPYFEKKDFGKYQLEFRLNKLKPIQPDGFIQGQSSLLELNKIFSKYNFIMDFNKFNIPFKCISTDIVTGNEVVIDKGILPKALRASLSIPTVFAPVVWGDSLLIDGGVINNLPTNIAKDMGADIIIAIDVGTPMRGKNKLNGITEIMEQAMGILEYRIEEKNAKLADLVIKPDLSNYKSLDFSTHKINGMVQKGLRATQKNISQLLVIKNKLKIDKKNLPIQAVKLDTVQINKIFINGLNKISESFFLNLLGINKKPISITKLNKKIQSVYGLGYFKIIEYYFEDSTNESKHLIINIIEQPEDKLRLGIKWDNENQIVVTTNVQFTNIPFAGFRIENSFNFGGIRKNIFNIYYPSKGLDYPFYPFFRAIDSWQPITKFNLKGDKTGILNFYDQFISFGFGSTFGNYWITELDYKIGIATLDKELGEITEKNILYYSERYNKSSLKIKLDNLDDNISPEKGIELLIKADYSDSFKENDFLSFKSFLDIYIPINKHTWRSLIYFNFIKGDEAPYQYYLLNKTEKFHAGIHRHGVISDRLLGARAEFIYEYKYDVFFHLFYNPIIHSKYQDNKSEYIHSGGMMVELESPLGPINFTWSYSPNALYTDSKFSSNFYLSAGYEF